MSETAVLEPEAPVEDELEDVAEPTEEPTEEAPPDPHAEYIQAILRDQNLVTRVDLSVAELTILDTVLQKANLPTPDAKIVAGFAHSKIQRVRASVVQ